MYKWINIKKKLFKHSKKTEKVMCKECWEFKPYINKKGFGWCASYNVLVSPTDRCSYGDRKV